jgi:hypothetical protein
MPAKVLGLWNLILDGLVILNTTPLNPFTTQQKRGTRENDVLRFAYLEADIDVAERRRYVTENFDCDIPYFHFGDGIERQSLFVILKDLSVAVNGSGLLRSKIQTGMFLAPRANQLVSISIPPARIAGFTFWFR